MTLELDDEETTLSHGSVVIAAITSCTNTSDPSVMIGAGLLAQKRGGARPGCEAMGEDQHERLVRVW